jgi:hypothetical protein
MYKQGNCPAEMFSFLLLTGSLCGSYNTKCNQAISELSEDQISHIKSEIIFAVQIGYMLHISEEIVKQGEPSRTSDKNIPISEFTERVIDWPKYYIHSPIEMSLSEFNGRTTTYTLSKEKEFSSGILSIMKSEIESATLYGCAAAAIEETW